MNREQLDGLSRKELLALLPEGHGFSPVASKKAEIIDAVIAYGTDSGDTMPVALGVTTYGIVIRQAADVWIRYTPLGGGKWRCEATNWPEDDIVGGGVDVAHNGQWLILDGLGADQKGWLRWDGRPLPPTLIDPKELE